MEEALGEVIYLDTNALLFLAEGRVDLFGEISQGLLDGDLPILVSPIVILELEYLYELKKIRISPDEILEAMSGSIGVRLCHIHLVRIVESARKIRWTREPFDRLIAAQAIVGKGYLVTRDRTIRGNLRSAVW